MKFTKKIIYVATVISMLYGCTTIYKVPMGINTIYLFKKKSKVNVFDFKDRNSFTKGLNGNFIDLPTHHELNVKIEKQDSFIVYSRFGLSDTLAIINKEYFVKDSIVQILLPALPTVICNGIPIYKSLDNFKYLVNYDHDSIVYFNNHPPQEVFIFNYYAFYSKDSISSVLSEPISLFISKKDGMVLGLSYFLEETNWMFDPYDLNKYIVENHLSSIDYSKVFLLRKKRMRKFLM